MIICGTEFLDCVMKFGKDVSELRFWWSRSKKERFQITDSIANSNETSLEHLKLLNDSFFNSYGFRPTLFYRLTKCYGRDRGCA